MAALAEEAVKRNAWRIQWAVLDWNVRAIQFYERLGAEKDDWLHFGFSEAQFRKLAEG